jgi:hypothetical protein
MNIRRLRILVPRSLIFLGFHGLEARSMLQERLCDGPFLAYRLAQLVLQCEQPQAHNIRANHSYVYEEANLRKQSES